MKDQLKSNSKNFKMNMKKTAKRLGISLLQLRKKIMSDIKINKQTLSHWENGKFKPSTENLIYLRDLFQIKKIDSLLN
jgi:transcriptional regulator with XRE-family HTH domain